MSASRRLLTRLFMLAPRPLVWRFAKTYIAGETLDDAIQTIRELNAEGCRATLDVLGESVAKESEVEAYVDEYVRAVEAIVTHGVDANVSIKPTAMGIELDADLAFHSVEKILIAARAHGMTVRMDMEDTSVTQVTLDLYDRLRAAGYDNVGVVLQAYLRRTIDDVRQLAARGASVRICKGIYIEPRDLAYQDFDIIRQAFVDAVRVLLASERGYAAIATHDEWLVMRSRALLGDFADSVKGRYEFQMLLGVDAPLRQMIVREGHPLRVYVPYGKGWHPYSIRRLVENPRLAAHVTKNVLGFGPRSR